MKNDRHDRGFSLVEVMIAVVIIGILAGLVVPRVTAQRDVVEFGEAQQMLGVIRKAQLAYNDSSSDGTYLPLDSAAPPGSTEFANFSVLGLQVPESGRGSSFRYMCSGSSCSAFSAAGTLSLSPSANLSDGSNLGGGQAGQAS